jgi:hypothetical protein
LLLPLVTCVAAPRPSCGAIQISSSPVASEMYAIQRPSGDHFELRSCTPGVRVRLRVGPNLAGTVKTSPRAPNRARLPSGAIS